MIQVTFLGQCGFILNFDGKTVVLDPYLSDYLDRKLSTDDVKWERKFPAPTTLAHINPDIVLISHRHEDHLDPWTIRPYAKSGGKALFVAPYAAKECLQKLGVHNIRYMDSDDQLLLDSVKITAVPCAHPELHYDQNGKCIELSYIIQYGGHAFFFGGDMLARNGLAEQLVPYTCDLMMLPCNGRDAWRDARGIIGNTTSSEAAAFAKRAHATVFIPMHHDLYEINSCSDEQIYRDADAAGIQAICMKPLQTLTLD